MINEKDGSHSGGIIGVLARHKVAPNLLMIIMLLLGYIALLKINIQFFPSLNLTYVTVQVSWTGANSEDVEQSLTIPIERALRNLDDIDEITSTAVNGATAITLKFTKNTDMGEAVDLVKQKVDQLRNLPKDAEKPIIKKAIFYEGIAKLLITSEKGDLKELRSLAHLYESELLAAGIDKITINGMDDENMNINIPQSTLESYGLSLTQIAEQIKSMSKDLPAGTIGNDDAMRDVRASQQARNETQYAKIPIIVNETEQVFLGNIANIERKEADYSPFFLVNGKTAIGMFLQRSENGDTIKSADILHAWIEKTRPTLPEGVSLEVYDEVWSLVQERISLLVNNGLGGLVLVVLILFVFMNGRVAFWVAVGIPASFSAALMVLYLFGGSINLITLFALIMALGIVVDDAIVVGEDALAHFEKGESALQASVGGANRMFPLVVASSLTTIAAFVPLMMIGEEMGEMLFAIPLVVIAVILASLFESFAVLPGHLHHAFQGVEKVKQNSIRFKIDKTIDHFRNHQFRDFIRLSLNNRGITIISTLTMLVFVISLIVNGRIGFVFFPSPDSTMLNVDVQFVAGTTEKTTHKYMNRLNQALLATEQELEPGILKLAVIKYNQSGMNKGSSFGGMTIELVDPDKRKTRNAEFIKLWQEKAGVVAGLDVLSIRQPTAGPPGSDIDIRMWGVTPEKLKKASVELQQTLASVKGVLAIRDDLPYGREQLVYNLTAQGYALGFTYSSVARQLGTSFSGNLVQIFNELDEEIEVRVQLPKSERDKLSIIERMQLVAPNGERVPLSTVVNWTTKQGFDAIRHLDGRVAISVLADVDRSLNNANNVLDNLEKTLLPKLIKKYGINYSLEGQSANQANSFADMKIGLLIGLAGIYIVLAWVFSSYGWPLVVMMAIPFGLIGAIMGHWLMGIDLTLLSIFGFFGLSGIVVNDSIILVSFYKRLRAQGMAINQALEEAAVQRVRAVLLTSLTTIAGLTPLLFETSLQAQFLIPMATSIAFGLLFSTLLILLVIPSFLSIYEGFREQKAL
jgi:multidrug efflux pump subunit AcrB